MREVLTAATAVARGVPGIVTAYDGMPDAAPGADRLIAAVVRPDPEGGTVRLDTSLKTWVYPFWVDILTARGGEARLAEREVQPLMDAMLDAFMASNLAGAVLTGEVRWVISPIAYYGTTYIGASLRLVAERMTEATYWPE